jgi:hypothetical protein
VMQFDISGIFGRPKSKCRSSPWSDMGMSGFLPDAEWGAMDIRKGVLLSKLTQR